MARAAAGVMAEDGVSMMCNHDMRSKKVIMPGPVTITVNVCVWCHWVEYQDKWYQDMMALKNALFGADLPENGTK